MVTCPHCSETRCSGISTWRLCSLCAWELPPAYLEDILGTAKTGNQCPQFLVSSKMKKIGGATHCGCLFLLPSTTPSIDCISPGPRDSQPRPPLLRALACPRGHAPERMELTLRDNQVPSFCTHVEMESCLGPESGSPVWLQTSLSIFFCSVHLHKFREADGESGEKWWELRSFSPWEELSKTRECLL